MKVNELLEELKTRDSYKEYFKENPSSFFCAGFFILGEEQDKIQLDYYSPSTKRITSFEYPFASYQTYHEEILNANLISEEQFNPDLDKLKDFIKEKTNKFFTRLIAILKDGYWNITLLNGLSMSRMKIDYKTGELIENENGNLSDFIKFDKKN
ncbi:MAG: hypothetical protein WC260_02430 [Candidatus Pacearchaeota archaeon]